MSPDMIHQPLNILWFSNSTWMPTGYGNQTKVWTHRLAQSGYGVVVAAYRGLEGGILADNAGVIHLPRSRETHCNDCIQAHYRFAQTFYRDKQPTNLVFSLLDIFAADPRVWKNMPWASWTPVDCQPILANSRKQFLACRYPIAMSRFAELQMKDIGLKPLYVPHGLDSQLFRPADRSQARRNLLDNHLIAHPIPDDVFLVTIVGNNGEGYRKNFSGMLEAFQMLSHEYPNVMLYIHADITGVHGIPLDSMIQQFSLQSKVLFPQPYAILMGLTNESHLVDVYNAADVKLMLSFGEGFGLSDVESQLCGTPLIGTDFSASSELNFTGWKIPGPLFQHVPLSYQMRPDSYKAAEALVEAYKVWQAGKMPELRERTRQAALVYDVETVLKDHFIPALDFITEDLKRTSHVEWLKQTKQFGNVQEEPIPDSWANMVIEPPKPPTEEQLKIRQAVANARSVLNKQKVRARW